MTTQYATYCPEDDKLRLYVGRVPRDEYEALRAEGWVSTPKQDCDFVAVWTPQRRNTALKYSEDGIMDEDMGPEDRAADRAERFGGYQEKRLDEATGHADRYDAGPSVHGAQSYARAVRAADRHDRIAGRAVDAWEKAEYWQRRTAGVISHALHVSSPAVRMGRIKTIEAEIRQIESYYTPTGSARIMQEDRYGSGEKVAHVWCGMGRGGHWVAEHRLETLKASYADSLQHLHLRLAYENQMLEAQGGRLASVEIEPGGYIGGKLIVKVNKSPATGRVTSVSLKGPKVQNWTYRAENVPGTDYALHQFDTERMPMSAYTPPTDESRAELAALKQERKAALPKKDPCPLINPTDEDAERLQAALNERAKDDHCARHLRAYGRDYAEQFKPSTICRIPQAVYSENSKGSYARAETRGLCRNMELEPRKSNMYGSHEEAARKRRGPKVCEVRTTSSDGSDYGARRVIIITDKPQKPFPVAVWQAAPAEPVATPSQAVSVA